ncbi:MAG: phosphatase PAP2 family protein [Magnetococcus sp. DMHC-1]
MNLSRPLPHEWSFGFLLLTLTLASLVNPHVTREDTRVFSALTCTALLLFLATRGRPGVMALRWRLVFYPLAMNMVFQQMRTALPAIHPVNRDSWLQALDGFLMGVTPSLAMEPWIHPWLTEGLSFCYILFIPYLLFSFVYYLFAPPETSIRFYSGLFTLYAIGFFGYLLVPAAGPWIAMADRFTTVLEGGWITRLNTAMVIQGSNRVDVFPSLHCAVSTYLLMFDRRFKPWRYKVYLVPCLGLWVSTLYLRYHYLVDIIAGFLLAVFCLNLAFSQRLSNNLFISEKKVSIQNPCKKRI